MKNLKAKFKKALFNYFQDEILEATIQMHTRTEIKYNFEKLTAVEIQSEIKYGIHNENDYTPLSPVNFAVIKAKKKLLDEMDKYIKTEFIKLDGDSFERIRCKIIIAKYP